MLTTSPTPKPTCPTGRWSLKCKCGQMAAAIISQSLTTAHRDQA